MARVINNVLVKKFAWLLVVFAMFVFARAADAQMPVEQQQPQIKKISAQARSAILDRLEQALRTRVIVRLKGSEARPEASIGRRAGAALERQQQFIADRQARVLERLGRTRDAQRRQFRNLPVLAMPVSAAELAALEALPEVVSIEPDVLHAPNLNSSVPVIGGDAAWALGASGIGQAVAILDTGVDAGHAFFQRAAPGSGTRVVEEACFSTTSLAAGSSSLCPNGAEQQTGPGAGAPCTVAGCDHGTHVAGIAASGNATYAGVAPDADIIAIQVFSWIDHPSICGGCVRAWTSDFLAGLDHVLSLSLERQIAAVNLSLGASPVTSISACPGFVVSAIDNLLEAGIATVISAGNEGRSNALASPGCVSAAVTVGATTDGDSVASFSNSASWMDFFAPGSGIVSAKPGSGTIGKNGTSMSAPHVAGAITALRSLRPEASVGELVAALTHTAVPVVDPDNGFSIPRIQVDAAAQSILPGTELTDMVIVDDDDGQGEVAEGDFEVLNANQAYGGRARRATGSGLDVYRFTPQLSCSGVHRLYGWWPSLSDADAAAEVDVYSQDGQPTPFVIDQSVNGGQWIALGDFAFGFDAASNFVEISSPGNGAAVADALRFDLLAADPLQILTTGLPTSYVDFPYASPVVASGCRHRTSYEIVSGTLPPGFTLDSKTGLISGTATATASSAVTIRATNLAGEFDEIALTLDAVVNQPPQITSISANPAPVPDSATATVSALASDPDDGPNPLLSYQWLSPAIGSLAPLDSATPTYTPPNIVGSQLVTLTVRVSDGQYEVEDSVAVTVQDADPPPAVMPQLDDPSNGTMAIVANDPNGLNQIDGLAFDGFGNLFGALEVGGPAGGLVRIDTETGIVTSLLTGIPRADQVALHPSGTVFITNEQTPGATTNRIYRANFGYFNGVPTPGESDALTTTLPINNPEGLAVLDQTSAYGTPGELLVAEDAINGQILRLNTSGGAQVLTGSSAALQRPEGIAFGDFGGAFAPALYVAETSRNRIVRIEPDGSVTPFGDPGGVELLEPDNLEFGWDGYLYVTEDRPDGRLIRVGADGVYSVVAGSFAYPQGLAFEPATGDLYLSAQDERRVYALRWSAAYRDAHASVPLYEDMLGTLPDAQPWLFYASDAILSAGSATHNTVADGVNLTTDVAVSAGFTSHVLSVLKNAAFPMLERSEGFELRFQLKINSESHVSNDRAGFSVIVLSDDLRGIELGFWADEIWAQSDLSDLNEPPALFKHAEGTAFDTTQAEIAYRLAIEDDTYRLYANGVEILSGPLRDYSSFGIPYNTPSFVFFGDNTGSAGADVTLGKVSLWTATAFDPASPPTDPVIVATSASPAAITDVQTSSLRVVASDPDHAPNAALSYAWTVPAGGGSLDDASSATPVYTPPDVSSTQVFTLSVEVSDGASVTTGSVDVTVSDSDAPPVLLSDDFADGNLFGWTVVDEGTILAPSAWSAATGTAVQSSNICYNTSRADWSVSQLGTFAWYGNGLGWTDYTAALTLRSQDNDTLGVMFRYTDANNYYRFTWDAQNATRRLVKREGNVFSVLAEDAVPYVTGQSYAVSIRATGALLEVLVDGVVVLSAVDAAHAAGSIGLYSACNAGSSYDDVVVSGVLGGNLVPVVSSVSATPNSVSDAPGSQSALEVVAVDPDTGPNPVLSYAWTVPAGGGSLDDASSATPVYTPPDVSSTQVFTLSVEVSDGASVTTGSVDVTVSDADAPPVLLSDDFTDGNLLGWTVVDEGTISAPSAWSAATGTAVQSSNIYSDISAPGWSVSQLGTFAWYGNGLGWTDYTVALTLRSQDNDTLGVMFRYRDANNYYRFMWDAQRSTRRLVKREAGVFTVLDEDTVPYVTGQSYAVELRATGALLEVLVDGVVVLSAVDAAHAAGSIALYSSGNSGSYYDDVVVSGVSGDNLAPVVSSVSATPNPVSDALGSQSALEVVAVDPDTGPNAGLSYAWTVPAGGGSLDDASSATPVYTPPDVSSTQVFTLSVEVSDGASVTTGSVDVTVSDSDAPPVLLSDDFADGNLFGWTVVDEGTILAPSAWSAATGTAVQSSNICYNTSRADWSVSQLGTFAWYGNGLGWTDYTAALTLRSQDNDTLGVMFRYTDANNYYRFTWDAQNATRRLVKREGNVFSVLAEDAVPYVTGQSYAVSIRATGALLEVLVDGVVVLSAVDAAHAAGSIGLYSACNAGSSYDDVVVSGVLGGNLVPVVSSVSATPNSVSDAPGSQSALEVVAVDPDTGPNPVLSYAWTVPAGGGSLDDASSATPVYTPPDVSSTQVFTLSVEVSDGASVTTGSVDVTVSDADAPPVLLSDDFTDGNLLGWTVVDEGTISAPSAWSAATGTAVQSSNIYSDISAPGWSVSQLGTFAWYGNGLGWTDYTVALTLRSQDNDTLGVMFRYRDANNYYRFMWDAQRSTRRLVKREAGVFTVLDEDTVPYVTGQSYAVELRATGALLEVLVDGVVVLSAVDAAHAAGSIALYSSGNSGSYYDDVVVSGVSGDNLAPVVSSVSATPNPVSDALGSQSALEVVAVDPDTGPNAGLSYAWTVPAGGGSLDDASSATPVYTPPDVSSTQVFTLSVEVSDGASVTTGSVDVTVSDSDAPPVLLSDDFADGNLFGWTVVDEGTILAPSAWSAATGTAVQSSNICYNTSRADWSVSQLGTFAWYGNGLGWTDYTAALTLRSQDNDTLGVMFRYTDANNYYRFTWDAQNATRRLVKREGNVFSVLAEDAVPYVTGQSYAVSIRATGALLEVLVDGVVVLSAVDAAHAAGSIGLYSACNAGSSYDDVVVSGVGT